MLNFCSQMLKLAQSSGLSMDSEHLPWLIQQLPCACFRLPLHIDGKYMQIKWVVTKVITKLHQDASGDGTGGSCISTFVTAVA